MLRWFSKMQFTKVHVNALFALTVLAIMFGIAVWQLGPYIVHPQVDVMDSLALVAAISSPLYGVVKVVQNFSEASENGKPDQNGHTN